MTDTDALVLWPLGLVAVSVYVVVALGVTLTLLAPRGTLLEPLRVPLPVLMLIWVAPLTDQLNTLFSPLVIVAGVAVKVAIWGIWAEPKPPDLPAVPHAALIINNKPANPANAARLAERRRLQKLLLNKDLLADLKLMTCSE